MLISVRGWSNAAPAQLGSVSGAAALGGTPGEGGSWRYQPGPAAPVFCPTQGHQQTPKSSQITCHQRKQSIRFMERVAEGGCLPSSKHARAGIPSRHETSPRNRHCRGRSSTHIEDDKSTATQLSWNHRGLATKRTSAANDWNCPPESKESKLFLKSSLICLCMR